MDACSEDADDVDKNVLDAGWGESEEQATICFRSAMQDDRGQTGQSTDKRRVSMRPGSGIVRPVSSRPRSGKSRPDTRGILKSQVRGIGSVCLPACNIHVDMHVMR